MSLCNDFSIAARWTGGFDERGLQDWAEDLRSRLRAPQASLGLVFMSPGFFPHAKQVLEVLRVHARLPLLAGCSSQGLIVGAEEVEQEAGLTLGLYALPGAESKDGFGLLSAITQNTRLGRYPGRECTRHFFPGSLTISTVILRKPSLGLGCG